MIKDKNIDAAANIDPAKLGMPSLLGPKRADGTMPKMWYVSKGGVNGSNNGAKDNPFLGIQYAHDDTRVLGDDVIVVGRGVYEENVTFTKRVSLIGAAAHPGNVQIVGATTTSGAVAAFKHEALGGVVLANFEVGRTNTANLPGLWLVSSDVGSGSATTLSTQYRFLVKNVRVQDDNCDVGVLLEGTTLGRFEDLVIANCAQIGLALTGSAQNNPEDLEFDNIRFYGNVTADIATVTGSQSFAARTTIVGRALASLTFERMKHLDRVTTPVTNYVNFPAGFAHNQVNFFDCYAARDVADGTLLVIQPDTIWQGYSAAGAEFNIGV